MWVLLGLVLISMNITRHKSIEYAKELGLSMCKWDEKLRCKILWSLRLSKIDSWGTVDTIYLVDSAGCMTPNEVSEYITETVSSISTPIGFHGHNNLSLAV